MNIKLQIEYDGTNYAGWQKQPTRLTVQGVLENALAKILGQKITITGASRTDAGVSAFGQVANARIQSDRFSSLEKLKTSLNAVLPKDIAVKKISTVADYFNARRNSTSKIYRYQITSQRSPLQQRYAWHLAYALDIAKMRQASKLFIRHRDYAQFCSVRDKDGSVKIKSITIQGTKNKTVITIQANRFLYKMVRRIVGALAEIGRGHRNLDDIKNALAGQKHNPLICAPANGLILVKVKY